MDAWREKECIWRTRSRGGEVKVRILLAYPGHPGIRPGDQEEHLGMGYLAASLRENGHEVDILDGSAEGLGHRETAREIWKRRHQFDMLGLSCLFADSLKITGRLASWLKNKGLRQHITVGGHPPTFVYREILEKWPAIDSVVIGEGEDTLRELADALDRERSFSAIAGLAAREDGEIVIGPPRPMLQNLDSLPFPARDTVAQHNQTTPITTASILKSRGCYWRCSFCDTSAFYRLSAGRPWRSRTPGLVVDEMEQLVREHGVRHIRFWDDNFIGPGRLGKRLAGQLATEILERDLKMSYSMECRVNDIDPELFSRLKESGLTRVFLGIESGIQRSLDTFNKGVSVAQNAAAIAMLRELGLDVRVGFILFDPYTTLEELSANMEWLRTNVGPVSSIRKILTQPLNILEVYEGAPIIDRLRQEGLLRGDFTGYRYQFADRRVNALVKTLRVLQAAGFPARGVFRRLQVLLRAGAAPDSPVPR